MSRSCAIGRPNYLFALNLMGTSATVRPRRAPYSKVIGRLSIQISWVRDCTKSYIYEVLSEIDTFPCCTRSEYLIWQYWTVFSASFGGCYHTIHQTHWLTRSTTRAQAPAAPNMRNVNQSSQVWNSLPQNVPECSLFHAGPILSWKFHENPFARFSLHTDRQTGRQTNRQRWKHIRCRLARDNDCMIQCFQVPSLISVLDIWIIRISFVLLQEMMPVF